MAEFTILVLAIGCIVLVLMLWGMDNDLKKLKDESDVIKCEFNETIRKIVGSMSYSQRVVYEAYLTRDRISSQIAKANQLKNEFNAKNDYESAGHTRKIIIELEKAYAELQAKLDEDLKIQDKR